MSYSDVVARVAELQALAQRGLAPARAAPVDSRLEFADVLAGSLAPVESSGWSAVESPQRAPGLRALLAAQGEIGVSEEPPGSNDGARIAEYRSAVAGAYGGAP